jgi:hypothetical protein
MPLKIRLLGGGGGGGGCWGGQKPPPPPPGPQKSYFYAFHAQTVSQKSKKFEMDLGRLAPASEVAEGHTLPWNFKNL